jgi:hypothetical protein
MMVITRDKNNTQLIIIIKQIPIYPNLSISMCEREKNATSLILELPQLT